MGTLAAELDYAAPLYAAVSTDSPDAIYGVGNSEAAALAQARNEARDMDADFVLVPISAAAAHYVDDFGGGPDRNLVIRHHRDVVTLAEHEAE